MSIVGARASNLQLPSGTPPRAQFGIAFVSDPISGLSDGGIVKGNKISATHILDRIELCSSSNAVHVNTINGSAESAIHVDACAGILVGTAAGPDDIDSNAFFNTRHTVMTADQCTPPLMSVRQTATSSTAQTLRPSPVRP